MRIRTTLAALLLLAVAAAPLAASAQANIPNNPKSDYDCEYDMGYLKPVTVKQLGQVDDAWRVWIRPVCEYSPHAPVRNMGNATQLIGAIGRNEVLEAALDDKNYLPDDVVGVQLTKGERAILWVHPSLY